MHADTDGIVPGNALVVSFEGNRSQLWFTINTRWTPRSSSGLWASLEMPSWTGRSQIPVIICARTSSAGPILDFKFSMSSAGHILDFKFPMSSPGHILDFKFSMSSAGHVIDFKFSGSNALAPILKCWKAFPLLTHLASSVGKSKEQVGMGKWQGCILCAEIYTH